MLSGLGRGRRMKLYRRCVAVLVQNGRAAHALDLDIAALLDADIHRFSDYDGAFSKAVGGDIYRQIKQEVMGAGAGASAGQPKPPPIAVPPPMAAPMGPPAPRPVGNGGGGGGGVPARPQLKAQLSLASSKIADTLANHHGHLYRGGNPFARRLIQIADLQRAGLITAAQKAALKKRLLGLSFAGRDDVARLEKEMDDHIHQALGATALDASVRGAQLSKMSAMSMVSSDGRSGAAPLRPRAAAGLLRPRRGRVVLVHVQLRLRRHVRRGEPPRGSGPVFRARRRSLN